MPLIRMHHRNLVRRWTIFRSSRRQPKAVHLRQLPTPHSPPKRTHPIQVHQTRTGVRAYGRTDAGRLRAMLLKFTRIRLRHFVDLRLRTKCRAGKGVCPRWYARRSTAISLKSQIFRDYPYGRTDGRAFVRGVRPYGISLLQSCFRHCYSGEN